MTSLLPKKNKQLESLKIDVTQQTKKPLIKDDNFDPSQQVNLAIKEENDNESEQSKYSSRLQAVAISVPK